MQNVDFSTFKHDSPQHGKLTCLLCHERNDDSPQPKLAGHTPCASCHIQQFEDKSKAICTICHIEPVCNFFIKQFCVISSGWHKF